MILDREPHRYQRFISDIAGQDIQAHQEDEARVIGRTRDWLRACSGRTMPGGAHIHDQYGRFSNDLPTLCRALRLNPVEMTFNDYTSIVANWVADGSRR